MLVGPLEGAFLKLLVKLPGARRILEIGLFTGYSALTMAEALPEDGELLSCDIDATTAAIADGIKARAGAMDGAFADSPSRSSTAARTVEK